MCFIRFWEAKLGVYKFLSSENYIYMRSTKNEWKKLCITMQTDSRRVLEIIIKTARETGKSSMPLMLGTPRAFYILFWIEKNWKTQSTSKSMESSSSVVLTMVKTFSILELENSKLLTNEEWNHISNFTKACYYIASYNRPGNISAPQRSPEYFLSWLMFLSLYVLIIHFGIWKLLSRSSFLIFQMALLATFRFKSTNFCFSM